jgi:PAS domain S-box-containing protein
MLELLRRLFSADGFMPHGHCYFWDPRVIWLHVVSDALIALSYMTIPFTLTYFIRRRNDLPFPFVFWAFGLFIVSCGMTHVMEIWTLWTPTYWLSGGIKAVTALTSVTTAVILVRLMPEALEIPSPRLLREAHDRLAVTEARFRAATEQMKDAFSIFDSVEEGGKTTNLRLVEANEAAIARFAKPREELVGKLYTELLTTARESGLLERFLRVVATGEPLDEEIRLADPAIRAQWVHVRVVSLGNGIAVTSTEVTERRRVERERELHTAVVKNMSEGLTLVRETDGIIVYTNPKFDSMLGYPVGALEGEPFEIVVDAASRSDSAPTARAIVETIRRAGEAEYESRNVRKDGRTIMCQSTSSIIRHEDHGELVVSVHEDISERKRADEELRKSNVEREVLLKEIHHRVKNNLQVISSLLKLHAEKVTDPVAQTAFNDSQNRVRSIALLHEQLYQSSSLADVNVAKYAETLVHTLLRASAHAEVVLMVDGGGVSLPMDSAVPFGLVLNELVTNCLKHGFANAGGKSMRLRVVVRADDDVVEVVVADNGPGFRPDFDPKTSKSLGMHLILALVGQLEGTIDFSTKGGAEATFRFPRPQARDIR